MRSRIPPYVRTWIISLHKSGMSTPEILDTLDSEGESVTRGGVEGVISRFQHTRSVADRPRTGRPLAHDIDIVEIIDRHLKKDDELTAGRLQDIILKETGAKIPHTTIKTARKKAGWVCTESNLRKFVKKPTGKKRLIFSLKNMKELAVRESDEVLPTMGQASTSTFNMQAFNIVGSPLPQTTGCSSHGDANLSRTTSEAVGAVEIKDDGDEDSCPSSPTLPPPFPEKEQPVTTQPVNKIQEEQNSRIWALEKRVIRLQRLLKEETAMRTKLEQKVQKILDSTGNNDQYGDTTAFESTPNIGQGTNQNEVSNTIQNTDPAHQSSQLEQMSADNHNQPLEWIFKTYLGQRTVFQGKWCYEPTQKLLNEIVMYGHNPPALAREVLRKIFTPYELAVSNVRGYKKVALDVLRVQTIRMLVVKMCNVPESILDHCWTVCVRAMDQALRNDRKSLKKKNSVSGC